MPSSQSAHVSRASGEHFLKFDRDGAVPLTDDVGAWSCAPRGRGCPLVETGNAEWLQLCYRPACNNRRYIGVKHLVRLPWHHQFTVDDPPCRDATTRQAQDRFANIELESRDVDEMTHIGHIRGALRYDSPAVGVRNDNDRSADPIDLHSDSCDVIAQTLARQSWFTGARKFRDVCLPAPRSERAPNLVPGPATMPSAWDKKHSRPWTRIRRRKHTTALHVPIGALDVSAVPRACPSVAIPASVKHPQPIPVGLPVFSYDSENGANCVQQ